MLQNKYKTIDIKEYVCYTNDKIYNFLNFALRGLYENFKVLQ